MGCNPGSCALWVLVVYGRCLADFVMVPWLLFLGYVGQVMGLDRWISVSWVRWWCGFGSMEIGGLPMSLMIGCSRLPMIG